jgi:hypothetical protein
MRRLFNPITLFVTVTAVALVSTAVSAKGPAVPPKSRNAASAHQPTEKESNDKPAVSNGSPRRGGSISIVNSGNGVGNSIRMNAAGAPRNPDSVTDSGNGTGNSRQINGLPIVAKPSPGSSLPVSAGTFTNSGPSINNSGNGSSVSRPIISAGTFTNGGVSSNNPGNSSSGGQPVKGPISAGTFTNNNPGNGVVTGVEHLLPVNPGNGVITGVEHLLPVNPGNGVITGVEHLLPINPPGSNPGHGPINGIPPVYHPPGSGNRHPSPPTGTGATTVTYFGGSVPVAAAAPTADNTAATTANVPANDEAASLTNVPAGATIKLDGSDFGAQPGRVTIVAGNMILPTDVVSWTEKSVSLTLPQIEMTAPMHAKFVVHRANGSAAMETPFQLSDRAK